MPPSAPTRSLRLSFLWALFGNVITAAAQWAFVILLARLAGVDDVGRYALALGITSPLLNFTNLQLRAVQATQTGSDFHLGHFVALRLITSVLFLVALAFFFLGAPLPQQTAWVLLAVAFSRLPEAASDLIYGHLQHQERMDRIAQSQIVRAVSTLAALTYGMASGGSPLSAILLSGLAGWASVLFFDLPVAVSVCGPSALRPVFASPVLRSLAWLALPLGFTQILNSTLANLPRYLLEHWHGDRAVGLFSAQAYAIVAANVLVVALGQTLIPRAARAFESDLPRYFQLASRLLLLGALLAAGGLAFATLFGPATLTRIYGPAYGANPTAIQLLMVAGGLSYLSAAMGCCLTAARQFLPQMRILAIANAVTLTAGLLLVPAAAIEGAAIAHALGYAAQCAASIYYLRSAIAAQRRQHAAPVTLQSSLPTACLES
ncbi:MAG: oligosaccharide flippase family protein [Bryobacterales bacterium]|nr:oligosaccharide flippase family protein [Bryobacterales bacterium]